MGMVASAEAPAAKRKKLRREKPLQVVGSCDECMGKTPLGEYWLGIEMLDALGSGKGQDKSR